MKEYLGQYLDKLESDFATSLKKSLVSNISKELDDYHFDHKVTLLFIQIFDNIENKCDSVLIRALEEEWDLLIEARKYTFE